ncbi:hypothetical protein AUEXF2481DRAFT_34648 [Aureobasidium subglaciale EXF-2481]|uniref:Uncharacterized protein n=1 Tax=Aureobasidium subglaciale (strain EXF-2481) TaxID=1043005 RepID=A0A074YWC9_AURSE|nr:uncharacterized protein AUEXF2481DRAFT_34648 [Aureobasidium subglaciale EXF-2481]KER00455.1 hypothetical protein AUEXF2481DRAFT_34648 [Aureobasidium subglaciale EXF-2481]
MDVPGAALEALSIVHHTDRNASYTIETIDRDDKHSDQMSQSVWMVVGKDCDVEPERLESGLENRVDVNDPTSENHEMTLRPGTSSLAQSSSLGDASEKTESSSDSEDLTTPTSNKSKKKRSTRQAGSSSKFKDDWPIHHPEFAFYDA